MSRVARLGFFIVTTLVILLGGVFLIGNKRFLFSRTYRLSAQFQEVGGLANGADVQVGGIHMGTVKYISLPGEPGGKLTVVMDMSNSTKNIIRQDSVAAIKTEGLLGNKYVEISSGSEKAPPIEDGDTIRGQPPADFEQAALAATNQAKNAAGAFEEDANALKSNFLLRGYFEKRGYEDTGDLEENRISHLPNRKTSKKFIYDAKDLFDKPDDAKLRNQKRLKDAGQYLEDNKFNLAVVAASKELGDTNEDRTLTEARAKVVRDYLVQNFKLDDTHLKIIGLGKSGKADESSTVEIMVYN